MWSKGLVHYLKGMKNFQLTLVLSRKAKLYLLDEPIGGVGSCRKR